MSAIFPSFELSKDNNVNFLIEIIRGRKMTQWSVIIFLPGQGGHMLTNKPITQSTETPDSAEAQLLAANGRIYERHSLRSERGKNNFLG